MATVLNRWKGDDPVASVAVSPDSARIGAACGNNVVIVDAGSGQTMLGPLQGHTWAINSVTFSPDGRTLASSSWDSTIRFWDAETGQAKMQPLTGHDGLVNSVAFTSDGRLLVSGSSDGTIRLWDARTGQLSSTTIHTEDAVCTVAVSPDGKRIACGCDDNTIRMHDTATRGMLFQCTGHTEPITSVAFSPNGHCLASGSHDFTVRLWDGLMGHVIGSVLKGHGHWVQSVAFSPDGRYIASASYDGTIQIWDADGTRQCHSLSSRNSSFNAGFSSIAFTPDGSRIVSGSSDNFVKIWDIRHLGVTGPVGTSQPTEPVESATRNNLPYAGPGDMVTNMSTEPLGPLQPPEPVDLEIEITATMSEEDIVSHLGTHGCIDMTNTLDVTKCSDRPISSGGFGDIYRCELRNGTEVAIKTIRLYAGIDERNCKALKRAAREIYTWSKCRHPNVQPLLGLAVFRGQIGMVATWEANGNLSLYLRLHPKADRCAMSTQVAGGLAYLHASGVVHGDLKAANVLVSKDGVAQLADFGSAVLYECTLQFSQTSTKTNLTVRWASPELFRTGKCSTQADIYALGMTILEILTGEVPWSDKNDLGVQFAVVMEKAIPERPLAHITKTSKHGNMLWSLLKSCWTYEPDERPSAESVFNTLRGITQVN